MSILKTVVLPLLRVTLTSVFNSGFFFLFYCAVKSAVAFQVARTGLLEQTELYTLFEMIVGGV